MGPSTLLSDFRPVSPSVSRFLHRASSLSQQNRRSRAGDSAWALLDAAYVRMRKLLDTFRDQETLAKKRTKKVLATERDAAELHRKISEQAGFFTTRAAEVLQAAEQQGPNTSGWGVSLRSIQTG